MKYEKPQIEVINITIQDIILASKPAFGGLKFGSDKNEGVSLGPNTVDTIFK